MLPMSSFAEPIDGVRVMLPELLESLTPRIIPRPAGLPAQCCWERAEVLMEASTAAPLLVSAHDFLCKKDHQNLRRISRQPGDGLKWIPADIHKNEHVKDNVTEALLRGNGFPGWRLVFPEHGAVGASVVACLRPLITAVWGSGLWGERGFAAVKSQQHLLGLVSAAHQPGGTWLDAQRLPHNDIRWDIGNTRAADGTSHVPPSIATVLGLTSRWNESGTTLWRVAGTSRSEEEKPSLLTTVEVNSAAFGGYSNRAGPRSRYPDADVRQEVPDPHPHALLRHKWAEAIAVAQIRFNRIVLYDGRRLHNRYINKSDYVRLSTEPGKGRLTMNSFLWQSPPAHRAS